MALNDLDLILNKDAVIATYPASFLQTSSADVEEVYRTHARTHIPLGDTKRYVETIFKWVGGANKGAFIGGVIGDYGHGKTSFQVHIWDESSKQRVFAVPPFSWDKVSDMVDAANAWVQYIVRKIDVSLARQAERIYTEFKEKSLHEVAAEIASKSGRNIDEVLSNLRDLHQYTAATLDTKTSPARFLDYCQAITPIVKEAGFAGFLVLLDEPELAAKTLGTQKTAEILFELANGLLQRQGDYGIFISMPENFLASVQRSFSSLVGRLGDRNCLPRLRDIYGSDFAAVLWDRYVDEFDLDHIGDRVVSREALTSIGQVSSSERRDLSYGPRSVISAFRRMVRRYRDSGTVYEPQDFVDDCLEQEVLVSPDYATRIKQAMQSFEAHNLDLQALKVLAAFPNGLNRDDVLRLGVAPDLIEAGRRSRVIYKRGNVIGLPVLEPKVGGNTADRDELRDSIEEVFGEFSPSRAAFQTARNAFVKYILPKVFEQRQGQQFLGWEHPRTWREPISEIKVGMMQGAFRETEKDYPHRDVMIAVGPANFEVTTDVLTRDFERLAPDLLIKFRLRWNGETPTPDRWIDIHPGEPGQHPGMVDVVVDLAGQPLALLDTPLHELVEIDFLTPLGLLNLIGELDTKTFAREYQAIWESLRERLIRELLSHFFVESPVRNQAAELVQQQITGSVSSIFGVVCHCIFRERYPHYSTLLRQPQWQGKVDAYILALKNQEIPLAAKRGNEPWIAPAATVAKAVSTNAMNLRESFGGYGNLISVTMRGRSEDTEVVFKIHPLERSIREKVMDARPPRRLKIDSKEVTWWVFADELIGMFLCSGYQVEEIQKLLEVGYSRGTFNKFTDRASGKPVVYCLPLDLDQMKAQLREKLADLQQEIEGLSQLPDYKTSFDMNDITRQIEGLEDQEQFDKLVSRANKEFEQNHNRIPTYFDRLAEQFKTASSDAEKVRIQLNDSRQVSQLQQRPTGLSTWGSDLYEYIVMNLGQTIAELKDECRVLVQTADQGVASCTADQRATPLRKIANLQRGFETARTLTSQVRAADGKRRGLFSNLDEYENWRKLLSQSDEVHGELLALKRDVHVTKAEEMLSQIRAIWEDISYHLKTRNVQGLANYRQFVAKFDDLDQKRKTYIRELGVMFNRRKEHLNRLLQALELASDARCLEAYNPADSQGCEDRLISQAVGHIQRGLAAERGDLQTQRQELVYNRDVLRRLPPDEVATLMTTIDGYIAQLGDLETEVSSELVRNALNVPDASESPGVAKTPDALNDETTRVLNALRDARMIARDARALTRTSQPNDANGNVSASAAGMLALIPASEAVNLKQLILAMMEQERNSNEILQTALDGLSELFRAGKVSIKVELPRR